MTLTPEDLEKGEALLEAAGSCKQDAWVNWDDWASDNGPALLASARALAEVTKERDGLRLEVEEWKDGQCRALAELNATETDMHEDLERVTEERDALQVDYDRLAQWYADTAPTKPGQTLESNHMVLLEERDALKAMCDRWAKGARRNDEQLLALGKKWEGVGAERDAARSLVGHCWIHSGYPDCGYVQMSTEEKALYDSCVGREIPALTVETFDLSPEEKDALTIHGDCQGCCGDACRNA